MKSCAHEVRIDAPPEVVWSVLTDPDCLAADTGITRLEGTPAPGARLRLWSEVSPGRAFALRVVAFDPRRRMVWQGGMPLGLFTGRRVFALAAEGSGTRLSVEESFSGLLAGPFTRSMPDLGPSMEKFCNAVKRMSEERST